jgi:hypothetical protein
LELRQLRYFVRVVEYGSMGRAAAELGVRNLRCGTSTMPPTLRSTHGFQDT